LLNKIDLVPKEVLQKWLKYLRKDFPTIGFKSNTQNQKNNLGKSENNNNVKSGKKYNKFQGLCLGSDTLIKLLKNYSRSEDIKRTITVGIIGYPNVGIKTIKERKK
jgi:nuclear GTP-binding protein